MLKRWMIAVFLAAVFGLMNGSGLRADPVYAVDLLNHEPGQVIVGLAPGADIADINLAYSTITLDTLAARADVFLLLAPQGANLLDLVAALGSDPQIIYAELNYLTSDPESGSTNRIYGWSDSTAFKQQNGQLKLNLDESHAYTSGSGAVVAVLDTGLQLDHPEFAGVVSGLGFDFVDGDPDPSEEANGLDDDLDGQIDEGYGHGTHVAGIVHIVAPDAVLMPLRVLNSDSRGNVFRTAAAVYYAAVNGADAINMSLGSAERSILLSEAVADAAGMGVVVTAAAGNNDSSVPVYPAAEVCVLAVTSVKTASGIKSSFSSYGVWVDLAAIGEKITSTIPVDGYGVTSGTSMSAPFAAGQAALLRSLDPDLTIEQVGALIGATATPANDQKYDGMLGDGLLNVLASLEALVSGEMPGLEDSYAQGCTW